jgi:hypothetical protein
MPQTLDFPIKAFERLVRARQILPEQQVRMETSHS